MYTCDGLEKLSVCSNWQFSFGWLYRVCVLLWEYTLLEGGDDSYYKSCNAEHQLHLHVTFALYSTFSRSNLDTLFSL